MQQEITLPAECLQCETLFDMSYDLKENQDFGPKTKSLCWECRTKE